MTDRTATGRPDPDRRPVNGFGRRPDRPPAAGRDRDTVIDGLLASSLSISATVTALRVWAAADGEGAPTPAERAASARRGLGELDAEIARLSRVREALAADVAEAGQQQR
ncbi:hypothetical protein [Nocardia sp. NPDC050435]|uniref:hypothetical protein n=1 Tax=Nocardia sp. NPDC050435 TaxID=3155040 RepID=UPI0033F48EBB